MEEIDFDVDSIAHLLDADATTTSIDQNNSSFIQDSQQYSNTLSITDTDLSDASGLKGFNKSLGETWIYPINYPLREYQYKIAHEALFKNTLVCLPTGLGKTFIAAVVIYNMYRWYPQAKIVFMAPTKPLVKQQIIACMNIASIPEEDIAEITGQIKPQLRQKLWDDKRVFFITPQTLQNDLTLGLFPVLSLRLLVVDEAHHTRGKYSYGEVVRAIRQKHNIFRILALTATPGKSVEEVIEIIQSLQINRLEIRCDNSPDVKPYTHTKNIQTVVIKLDKFLRSIRDQYINIIDTYVRRLLEFGVLSGSMGNLHRGRIVMQYKEYQSGNAQGKRHPQHAQVVSDFTICVSLYHGLDLLTNHGYRVFLRFFDESGDKGWLYKEARLQNLIKELRSNVGSFDLNVTLPDGGVLKPKTPVNYGHPKFDQLNLIIKAHFAENPDARCIVFCEFRESVQLVHSLLLEIGAPIKSEVFMGTTGGKAGGPSVTKFKSLTQKQQLMVMQKFRSGNCNVLVSTCVAEEGIDVGEVDLIICFDTSTKNPTRLTQRMGRTGRQKSGRVVLLVTEGREEMVLRQSMSERNVMEYRIESSVQVKRALQTIHAPRMVPDNLQPRCVKMYLAPVKEQTIIVETSKDSETNKKSSRTTRSTRTTRSKNQADLREMFSKQIEKQKSPCKKTTDTENTTPKTSARTSLRKRKSGDLRQYLEISPKISPLKSQSTQNDMASQDVDVFKVPENIIKNKSKNTAKNNEILTQTLINNDPIFSPNESIYDGQDIPPSLADFITNINSDNIKNLLKNECDFCENVMKCDDKLFIKNNEIATLDFLKQDFIEPSMDWIKDLKNQSRAKCNEEEDSLLQFINQENDLEDVCEEQIICSQRTINTEILDDEENIEKHRAFELANICEEEIKLNEQTLKVDLMDKVIINKNTVIANNTKTKPRHNNTPKQKTIPKKLKNKKINTNRANDTNTILSYFKLKDFEDILDNNSDLKRIDVSLKNISDVKSICGSSTNDIRELFEEDFDTSLIGPTQEGVMTQILMPKPRLQTDIFLQPQSENQTSPIFSRKKPLNTKSKTNINAQSLHSTPKLENDFLKNRPARRQSLVLWDEESLFGDLNLETTSNISKSRKTGNESESLVSITQIIDQINAQENNSGNQSMKRVDNTEMRKNTVLIPRVNKSSISKNSITKIENNEMFNNIDGDISDIKENFEEDIIPATQVSPVIQQRKNKLNFGRLKTVKTFDTDIKTTHKIQSPPPYFEKTKTTITSKIGNSTTTNNVSIDLFDSSDLIKSPNFHDESKIDANKSIDSDETFVDQNDILENIESLLEDVDFEQDMIASTNFENSKIGADFVEGISKPSGSRLSSFKYTSRKIEFSDSDDDVFRNIPSTVTRSSNNIKKKTEETSIKKRKKSRNNVSQFLDCEAAMSGDEEDHYEELSDDEDLKSFIDFGSQEEKDKTDMTAQYLQSIRSPLKVAGFRVPKAVPPKRNLNIFSQIPEPDMTTYEQDSFCVYDEPTVYDHELSELDILEKKLKKAKKNSRQKRKRLKSDSEDDVVMIDSDEDSFLSKKSDKKGVKKAKRIKKVFSSSSDEDA